MLVSDRSLRWPAKSRHSNNAFCSASKEPAGTHVKKTPEGIEGQILQVFCAYACRAWIADAFIEFFQFRKVSNTIRILEKLQRPPGFHHGGVRDGRVLNVAKIRQDRWQTQTKVHDFQQRIITIANDFGIELHDGTSPKVADAVFLFELIQFL